MEAEDILDQSFNVLDRGFVRLIDYMGSDQRIVAAARVSYGKGTKSIREDQGLINYLMRNLHTSPFEQVVLTFHVKLPIFVARQWVRHRTARLNEISGRYSIMSDEFYEPEPNEIRTQSKVNKQGSSSVRLPDAITNWASDAIKKNGKNIYKNLYKEAIDKDIAREMARIILPLNLYTEWYWQIDLHNLFHFLKLRLDAHAQYEIREYAKVVAMITHKVAPMAYAAFEKYYLGGESFSKESIEWLKNNIDFDNNDLPKEIRDKLFRHE